MLFPKPTKKGSHQNERNRIKECPPSNSRWLAPINGPNRHFANLRTAYTKTRQKIIGIAIARKKRFADRDKRTLRNGSVPTLRIKNLPIARCNLCKKAQKHIAPKTQFGHGAPNILMLETIAFDIIGFTQKNRIHQWSEIRWIHLSISSHDDHNLCAHLNGCLVSCGNGCPHATISSMTEQHKPSFVNSASTHRCTVLACIINDNNGIDKRRNRVNGVDNLSFDIVGGHYNGNMFPMIHAGFISQGDHPMLFATFKRIRYKCETCG